LLVFSTFDWPLANKGRRKPPKPEGCSRLDLDFLETEPSARAIARKFALQPLQSFFSEGDYSKMTTASEPKYRAVSREEEKLLLLNRQSELYRIRRVDEVKMHGQMLYELHERQILSFLRGTQENARDCVHRLQQTAAIYSRSRRDYSSPCWAIYLRQRVSGQTAAQRCSLVYSVPLP